jgi:hypothetical protein
VNGFWFGQCLDVSGVVGFLVFWYMNHRSSCTNFHFIPTWPGTIVRRCIITKDDNDETTKSLSLLPSAKSGVGVYATYYSFLFLYKSRTMNNIRVNLATTEPPTR